MNKNIFSFILFFGIFIGSGLYGAVHCMTEVLPDYKSQQDTLKEDQILYNGKMWRNLYSMVKGDQFLFSKEYAQGSVTINGSSFRNILINYDIYNDEILTPKKNGSIVVLNKEMVDSFTMVVGGKTYRFLNVQVDSLPVIKGYVKVLYKGKSALFVKYKKEIAVLAVDDKYDLFFRTYRIYFEKEGNVYQISGKSGLLKTLQEDKTRVNEFMKKNKLKVTATDPESFIPVIKYYDSISR
jgi:hypothetical protein